MTRTDIIQQATLKGRKSWADYVQVQMRQLYLIFRAVADDLARSLQRYEKEGKIPPMRLTALDAEIKNAIPGLRRSLANSIKRGIGHTVDDALKTSILAMDAAGISQRLIQLGTSFIGKDGNVRRFNVLKQTYVQSAWHKVHTDAVKAVLAWKPDGLAFSQRVWDITYQTQKGLTRAIHMGVAEGRSAARISRDIRQMLALPDTFRGKALKDFHPGVGVYKSAYKNAMRLARTELNRAFAEATVRYAQRHTWIDGYIWRTGNIDACELCAPNNGKFFAKGAEPFIPVHPHCMCRLDLHIEGDPKE